MLCNKCKECSWYAVDNCMGQKRMFIRGMCPIEKQISQSDITVRPRGHRKKYMGKIS